MTGRSGGRLARSGALVASLVLGLATSGAWAVQPDEILPDTRLEARARAISADVRCLVCQNQTIDDSDAPLARDLRLLVRERLKAGDSDTGVREFIVSRYGSFVLLKPPFSGPTMLLWLGPPLLLGAGALAMVLTRRRGSAAASLSPEEEARLAAMIGPDTPRS